MKSNRTGTTLNASIEGAIGETTGLFTIPLGGVKEIILDLKGVTYINSIGVKHWILWTVRIPKDCQILILNAPFVIAAQASTVLGFVTPQMRIDSIVAPYACESCSYEETRVLKRGSEYEYAVDGKPRMLKIPSQLPCPKCGNKTLEADFLIDKTFKFLG